MSFFTRRRHPADERSRVLPVPALGAARMYQDHIPSFMSVYNVDENPNDVRSLASITGGPILSHPQEPAHDTAHLAHVHKHCDSTSTQTSESTDSSPTTTISTADSSALTDPSPSSSPESPVSVLPLSSFGVQSLHELRMAESQDTKMLTVDRHLERPVTSLAPRRPRNAKGLALKLPGCLATSQLSEPCSPSVASPSFIKPAVMKPRKKPSLLSLQTSATAFKPAGHVEPPTPGFKPTGHGQEIRQTVLRHHHSSPQMTFSPGPRFPGPDGGMTLPLQRSTATGLSSTFRKPTAPREPHETIYEEMSPIRTQMATRSMSNIRGDDFDIPHSQEDAKSPGYPNGPVQIYEPSVYLYAEPTADEAREFDVVINVADDVKNPFEVEQEKARQAREEQAQTESVDAMDVDRQEVPEPATAASVITFRTAFEFQPDAQATPTESSPTTPRPVSARPNPEYIHVPWKHGSDISHELLELSELIDKRVKEGKKVLVHCLQGQSRSASLIIAYGIYMNPDLTVNESYYAAQAKSRWISPNMKLMYALNDYRKLLHQKLQSSGYRGRRNGSPTKHRATMSADAIDYASEQPHTAPLPSERETATRNNSPPRTSSRPRGNSSPALRDISPGPSSAPSSFSWPTDANNGTFGHWAKDKETHMSVSQPASTVSGTMPPLPDAHFLHPHSFSARRLHQLPHRSISTEAIREEERQDLEPMQDVPLAPVEAPVEAPEPHKPAPLQLSLPPRPPRAPSPLSFGSSAPIKPQHIVLSNLPAEPPSPSLWSPRVQEMAGPGQFNFAHEPIHDTPPTPSIMSPRATSFNTDQHHRPTYSISQNPAESLGFGFVPIGGPTALRSEQDPRSPPTQGEAPILRSIDDMI